MAKLIYRDQVLYDNISAILFDKDGTLIDIHHYWASMIRLRSEKLVANWFAGHDQAETIKTEMIEAMGVNTETGRMKPEGPVGIKPRAFIVEVTAAVVSKYGLDKTVAEVDELFKEVDAETSADLSPLLDVLPDAERILNEAQACGVKLAIATTDISPRARKSMETLGWGDKFDAIAGADRVSKSKPDAEIANLLTEEMSVNKEQAVIIGDHPVDVKTGLAAGLAGQIGILTGLASKDAFDGLECKLVDSFKDFTIQA